MGKAKYVGNFINGVYQVAGGTAKSATRTKAPAVQVASGGSRRGGEYVPSRPPSVNPKYAKEEMGRPMSRIVIPDEQMTAGPNPGVIGGMDSNPIVPFNMSDQPLGAFPIAKYQPPAEAPMGSQLPAVIPKDPTTGRAPKGVRDRGGQQTYHTGKHQTFDEAYQPYIDMGGEIGEMATQAARGRTPVEEFLQTPYGGPVSTGEQILGPGGLERTKPLTIMEMITNKSNVEIKSDFVINPTRSGTIGDAVGAKQKSNGAINEVSSSNAGAGDVNPGDGGYAGFSGAFERHAGGAMVGAGLGMMSEGEVSMGGAARGAMFGMMGGKAARVAMGSMQGGAVNSMTRSLGNKMGGAADGSVTKKAGDYLSEAMDGFRGSKSQEGMRVATFAGAGLAGFSMGRDNNHSRGLNSGRGNRF